MEEKRAQKIINDLRKNYEKISRDFSKTRSGFWPEFEYFEKLTENGDRVLDLGCGNGRLFEFLNDKKIFYLGVDFSSRLIQEAKNKYEKFGAYFRVGNILDFHSRQKFDICFLVATLHHIPSAEKREKLLANIYDVLENEGKLVVLVWNLWQKKYFFRSFNYSLKSLFSKDFDWGDIDMPFGSQKIPRYYHAFSRKELLKLLQKSGFEIFDIFYSLDKKKTNTWKGRNLIAVGQKIG